MKGERLFHLSLFNFQLSKCYILISEPGCLELEGTVHGIVGVHGTGELGDAIALEGHFFNGLREERVALTIQRLDDDIYFLFISGQEEVAKGLISRYYIIKR